MKIVCHTDKTNITATKYVLLPIVSELAIELPDTLTIHIHTKESFVWSENDIAHTDRGYWRVYRNSEGYREYELGILYNNDALKTLRHELYHCYEYLSGISYDESKAEAFANKSL